MKLTVSTLLSCALLVVFCPESHAEPLPTKKPSKNNKASLPESGLYRLSKVQPVIAPGDFYDFKRELAYWKDRAIKLEQTETGYRVTELHQGKKERVTDWDPISGKSLVDRPGNTFEGELIKFVISDEDKVEARFTLQVYYCYRGVLVLDRESPTTTQRGNVTPGECHNH